MDACTEYEIGFFAPGCHRLGNFYVPGIACFTGLPTKAKIEDMQFKLLKTSCLLDSWQDAKFIAERDYHTTCDEYENLLPPSYERFILFKEAFEKIGYVVVDKKK